MCIIPSSVGNKEPLEISERDITPLLGSGFKEVLGSERSVAIVMSELSHGVLIAVKA